MTDTRLTTLQFHEIAREMCGEWDYDDGGRALACPSCQKRLAGILAAQPAPASGGEPALHPDVGEPGFDDWWLLDQAAMDAEALPSTDAQVAHLRRLRDSLWQRQVCECGHLLAQHSAENRWECSEVCSCEAFRRHPPASGTGSEDTTAPQEFVCYCGHPTSRHSIKHSALAACYDCGCRRFRAPSDQGEPHNG